jgi:hypothetical protein
MVPGDGLEPSRPLSRGIFIPTTTFVATLMKTYLWSGLYLYRILILLKRRQEPSSLYTFPDTGQGLARDCHQRYVAEVSPNLTPFTTDVSSLCAQINLSPLCLPIPPPGLWMIVGSL